MNFELNPDKIALILLMAFFSITFLQSAIDKVIDRKGNLEFLNGHFKNSPLAKQVVVLLSVLTLVEFLSGFISLFALIRTLISEDFFSVTLALTVCGINLLMLLVGQRLAKDYAGAATLGIYMALVLAGLYIV